MQLAIAASYLLLLLFVDAKTPSKQNFETKHGLRTASRRNERRGQETRKGKRTGKGMRSERSQGSSSTSESSSSNESSDESSGDAVASTEVSIEDFLSISLSPADSPVVNDQSEDRTPSATSNSEAKAATPTTAPSVSNDNDTSSSSAAAPARDSTGVSLNNSLMPTISAPAAVTVCSVKSLKEYGITSTSETIAVSEVDFQYKIKTTLTPDNPAIKDLVDHLDTDITKALLPALFSDRCSYLEGETIFDRSSNTKLQFGKPPVIDARVGDSYVTLAGISALPMDSILFSEESAEGEVLRQSSQLTDTVVQGRVSAYFNKSQRASTVNERILTLVKLTIENGSFSEYYNLEGVSFYEEKENGSGDNVVNDDRDGVSSSQLSKPEREFQDSAGSINQALAGTLIGIFGTIALLVGTMIRRRWQFRRHAEIISY